MKCLIDFGNTRCKWARSETGQPLSAETMTYSSTDVNQRIDEIVNTLPFQSCEEIHIVSVLGNTFEQQLKVALRIEADINPVFYHTATNKFGVKLSYEDPSTYGVDRYAAIVAAHHSSQLAKIIVDCGTAITVDALNEKGNHLGGLIVPGVSLMRSLLANKAAMIPDIENDMPVELLNHSTQTALHSGSVLSLKYGLQSMIQEMSEKLGSNVEVYVTGGESDLLGLLDHDFIHRPNLVLEGIQIMLD